MRFAFSFFFPKMVKAVTKSQSCALCHFDWKQRIDSRVRARAENFEGEGPFFPLVTYKQADIEDACMCEISKQTGTQQALPVGPTCSFHMFNFPNEYYNVLKSCGNFPLCKEKHTTKKTHTQRAYA